MEKFSSLKYAVILAVLLISSFQILCTEGRQIKSLDKKEVAHNIGEEATSPHFTPSSKHNSNVSVQQPEYTGKEEMPMSPPDAPTSIIGYHDSAMANKNDSQPSQTDSSPGIGHHFVGDSTDQGVDPKSPGATSGLEHSVTPSTNDFRPPTQTGSSPGIGHQSVDDSTDQEVNPKSPGATSGLEHSLTLSTNYFRPPTQTGSSPGIGHQLIDDSTDQEVDPKFLGVTSGLEYSVTPSTKDFPPTVPGHSLGHASQDKN